MHSCCYIVYFSCFGGPCSFSGTCTELNSSTQIKWCTEVRNIVESSYSIYILVFQFLSFLFSLFSTFLFSSFLFTSLHFFPLHFFPLHFFPHPLFFKLKKQIPLLPFFHFSLLPLLVFGYFIVGH